MAEDNLHQMERSSDLLKKPDIQDDETKTEAANLKSQPSSTQDAQPNHLSGLRLYILLACLYQGVFSVGAITTEFGTVRDVGWYTSSYLSATSSVQCLYGVIYRNFDTKWVYMQVLFIFEVGNLMAALSPTSSVLTLGRAISGIGDAGMATGTYVVMAQTMPLHERATYFGLLGAVWGVTSVMGPMLGGVFAEHATWRWCFWINLPIGGITFFVLGIFFIGLEKHSVDDKNPNFILRILELDLTGAAALVPGVIMLLLAIQWDGTELPWNFCGSGVRLLAFGTTQYYAQDRGLLPPRFFKDLNIFCALMYSFFFGATYFPIIPYISLFFQAIQSASAVQAGLRLLPLSISTVLSSTLSGILISALRNYNAVIISESALICVGAGLITTYSPNTPMSHWFGFEVTMGLGIGVGFQAGLVVVQNVLSLTFISQATSNVQFFNTLGGAIGVAAAQTLFQNGITEILARTAPQVPAAAIINTGVSQLKHTLIGLGFSPILVDATVDAYMSGLRHAYFWSTAMAACLFLTGLGIP
ncbi:major facilitator superfamily transporter [Colletotrichum falcatum]|nr:major facilitator superfamily transporter [Colletotrichum falcatum]